MSLLVLFIHKAITINGIFNLFFITFGVIIILNIYALLWIALTFLAFLIAVSKINAYRSMVNRGVSAEKASATDFKIENSFYKAGATLHDIIFFHASASGLATVLLILVIKGKILFPETVTFFGVISPVVIFMISLVLLLLAFYFFSISIIKLGTTLTRLQIKDQAIKTSYAIGGTFGYFMVFVIIVLLLI